MEIIVVGGGRQDFVNGLKNFVKINDCKDAIIVDIDNNTIMESSKFVDFFNSIDKSVRYEVVK